MLYKDLQIKTKNRGYCFLDFNSHNNAIIAKQVLYQVLPEIWNCENVIVKWAIPESRATENDMQNVSL